MTGPFYDIARARSGHLRVYEVDLLTADDFEGYDCNKPGNGWQLVRFKDNGDQCWTGGRLFETREEAEAELAKKEADGTQQINLVTLGHPKFQTWIRV